MADQRTFNQLASLFTRWLLALAFLDAGVAKLPHLEQFGQFIHQKYDATFLAGPLLGLFIAIWPFCEVIVGVLLVLGLIHRLALTGAMVMMLVLFFGTYIVGDRVTTIQNLLLFLAAAYALRHAEDDRCTVDALWRRRQ